MSTEILSQESINIHSIYAVQPWLDENQHLLRGTNAEVVSIDENALKKVSTLKTPNQVMVVAELPKFKIDELDLSDTFSLCLDGIRDPGNLGTILRTADWFGIPYVFCSHDTVDQFNPKVVQATMGALFRVKCIETNLHDLFWKFPDMPVLGCTLDGHNLYEAKLPESGFIIIGNESHGIGKDLFPFLSDKVLIPGSGKGAESLNAAVATGIVCAHLFQNKQS
ncbi:MAG: RNA methyltransferase [Bacteroidota bacterium]